MCRSWPLQHAKTLYLCSCTSLAVMRRWEHALFVTHLQVDLFYPWKISPTEFYVKVILQSLPPSFAVSCRQMQLVLIQILQYRASWVLAQSTITKNSVLQPTSHVHFHTLALVHKCLGPAVSRWPRWTLRKRAISLGKSYYHTQRRLLLQVPVLSMLGERSRNEDWWMQDR